MKSLKIIKKEYQRVGYDAQDIEPVEYTEGYAEYDDNGLLLREERYEPDGSLNTLTVNTYDGGIWCRLNSTIRTTSYCKSL